MELWHGGGGGVVHNLSGAYRMQSGACSMELVKGIDALDADATCLWETERPANPHVPFPRLAHRQALSFTASCKAMSPRAHAPGC